MTTKNHLQFGLVLKNMLSLRAHMMIRETAKRLRVSLETVDFSEGKKAIIHKYVEKAGFKSLKEALAAASEVKGL